MKNSIQIHKKKVMILITKGNWGGAQRYVFDLASTLDSSIFSITVIIGTGKLLKKKLSEKKINTIELPYLDRDVNFINEIKIFLYLVKLFKDEKPDIVHLNSSKMGGLGSLAARLMSIPKIVFTAHGWAFNEERSLIQRLLIKLLYWIIILLSHTTITVSSTMEKQIRWMKGVRHKIKVIHNGIGGIPFKTRTNARNYFEKITQKTIEDEEIVILTLAELHPIKGLTYAISGIANTLNQIPNITYVIMGSGQDYKKLSELIKEEGLSNHVTLAGHIDEASTYLLGADIFLLPSISEALGYTILEAGKAELPVIASNVGGIPEIIENDVTGLTVRPKDSISIAHALSQIIQNKQESRTLASNLKKSVESKFSIKTMVLETEKIYLDT